MTVARWTRVAVAAAVLSIGVLLVPTTASAATVAPAAPGTAASTAITADGTLTVMLMDPEKRALAMEGVVVELRDATGAIESTAMTTPAGRLTFEGVPTGRSWSLHGEREGEYGFADVLPSVRTGVTVTPGGHDTVVLVMRRGASIGGTARNPYGAALSGAAVVVRGWNTGTVRRTYAGPSGHYWVHGLPSDDYSVQYNAHDETGDSWPSLRDLGWGFHRDPGATTVRSYVRVANQAGGRTETVRDGVDGSVDEGLQLTGIMNPQLDTDFSSATVHVYGESIGSTFDTVMGYWSPGRGGTFGAVLEPGRYKVEVVGWSPSQRRSVSYWYGGEGNRPVASRALSHTVVVGDHGLSISFWSTRASS